MNKISTLVFILVISLFSYAQGQPTSCSVSGKVTNALTGAPLQGATVYISNSSKGDLTNAKGSFLIAGLFNGKYDLIISYIGFQTKVYHLLINDKDVHVSFSMNQAAKELREIVIIGSNSAWKKKYETFFRAFIGTDRNAKHTRILNAEVLQFKENDNILTVESKEMLTIRNEELGYRITYLLKNFYYNKNTGSLHYFGYPFFEEIESNRKSQNQRWERNREKVYRFSMLRFLRVLGQHQLTEQGYIIGKLAPKKQELSIIALQGKITKSNSFDITLFGKKYVDSLLWPHVPYDSLMKALPNNKYLLNFDGLLSVDATHTLGHPPSPGEYTPGTKFSVISLKKPVVINGNRLSESSSDIVLYGDWMNMRVANLLPFNYVPPSVN